MFGLCVAESHLLDVCIQLSYRLSVLMMVGTREFVIALRLQPL